MYNVTRSAGTIADKNFGAVVKPDKNRKWEQQLVQLSCIQTGPKIIEWIAARMLYHSLTADGKKL